MHRLQCRFIVVLMILFAAQVARGEPAKGPAVELVNRLIQQLGDDSFDKREEAGKVLAELGEPILPALRVAAEKNADLEIRQRAFRVARVIMLAGCLSQSTGLELVLIEAGEFQMGSPAGEVGRRPDEVQHRVRTTRPFLYGSFEVMQSEYDKVMKTNPSWFAPAGGGRDKVVGQATARFPVERVTWFDAVEFCNRLSKLDGYEPFYELADVKREAESIKAASVTIAGGSGYRLPTEAEWEYTCRAESPGAFHYGNANTGREANLRPGRSTGYGVEPSWAALGRTAKCGSYPPNRWGVYETHGNAAEWCEDWYDKDYYAVSPKNDPRGPERGTHRVVRGGSWMVNESGCRSANRFYQAPDEAKEYCGFRVCRTP